MEFIKIFQGKFVRILMDCSLSLNLFRSSVCCSYFLAIVCALVRLALLFAE